MSEKCLGDLAHEANGLGKRANAPGGGGEPPIRNGTPGMSSDGGERAAKVAKPLGKATEAVTRQSRHSDDAW
jgi:hypothetical protein